jgi:hypothetical protein
MSCNGARGGKGGACMREGRGRQPFIGGLTLRFEGKACEQRDLDIVGSRAAWPQAAQTRHSEGA